MKARVGRLKKGSNVGFYVLRCVKSVEALPLYLGDLRIYHLIYQSRLKHVKVMILNGYSRTDLFVVIPCRSA